MAAFELVYDTPVPGTPMVVRVRPCPLVTVSPRGPNDVDTPDFDRFNRTPGSTLIVLRIRNPTGASSPSWRAPSDPATAPWPGAVGLPGFEPGTS